MPDSYIRYCGKEADTDTEQIEYDLDREDAVWLKLANEKRKKHKDKLITEAILEKAIDRLEKESHFQVFFGIFYNFLGYFLSIRKLQTISIRWSCR